MKSKTRRGLSLAVMFALLALLLAFVGYSLFKMLEGGGKRRAVQQITLMRPPPPPPPPKLDRPPEPEVKEEIKTPEPEPDPQQADAAPPPGPDLGVDAEGGAGGDAFGLVGKKGGADLIGAGSGGSVHRWYADRLRDAIQDALARDKKLREKDYRVAVKVWLDANGGVRRVELEDSTGKDDLDRQLAASIRELPAVRDAMPEGMPMPVRLRVTSRS
jgi:protein TonB